MLASALAAGRSALSEVESKQILAAAGIPKDVPAFFFHGTGDELVSHEHTLALYEAAGSQKKHKLLIDKGSHGMILDPALRQKSLTMYFEELKRNDLLSQA